MARPGLLLIHAMVLAVTYVHAYRESAPPQEHVIHLRHAPGGKVQVPAGRAHGVEPDLAQVAYIATSYGNIHNISKAENPAQYTAILD